MMIGVTFRFYDYIVLKLLPNLRRDIQQQMLMYLEGHSYTYFQNNFAGSLSNKVTDMMRGISEIVLMSTDTFLASFLGVMGAMITM
ncbi:MAG: ABC transporter ATP-binding protein [Alphaproteobacteria bacterium]|nr:ABC transporter ATP-binding protein [Alphaproteobacteria bacterium]